MSAAGRRGGLRRPAGRIAPLSLLRWKIAKVFGGFNHPLPQPKAVANGASAAGPRAHLTALTHPRLTRLPAPLEQPGVAERNTNGPYVSDFTTRPARWAGNPAYSLGLKGRWYNDRARRNRDHSPVARVSRQHELVAAYAGHLAVNHERVIFDFKSRWETFSRRAVARSLDTSPALKLYGPWPHSR